MSSSASRSVLVPTPLPGTRWREVLAAHGFTVCEDPQSDPASHGAVISQLGTRWTEEKLSRLPRGFVISNFAVGFDNIDLDAARAHGVGVGNCPGVLTGATADLAVTLTLAAARRLGECDRKVRSGTWAEESKAGFDPRAMLGMRLRRRTLGIVGAGRIGGNYALKMALLHDMNVIYHNRTRSDALETEIARAHAIHAASSADDDDGGGSSNNSSTRRFVRFAATLDELLPHADVLSLHCPLTDTTRGLIGARELDMMPRRAILVNTARGAVVRQADLVAHLEAHSSFHAALDVFDPEPCTDTALTALDNVTLAPHVGSATEETRAEMSVITALNVCGALLNWPDHTGDDMDDLVAASIPVAKIPKLAPSLLVRPDLAHE
jgi:lactate dehydrogenase-like 2-hydroxyacid dehydrogenase